MNTNAGETVLLALGSNVGDRGGHLFFAATRIVKLEGVSDVASSRIWRTPAFGGPPGQADFYNAALRLTVTDREPSDFLDDLLAIERTTGRVRTVRNGPRTLDIDILLFGDRVIESTDLTVPHCAMHARDFVLVPAADVGGALVHGRLHQTVDALRARQGGGEGFQVICAADWHHALHHSQDC